MKSDNPHPPYQIRKRRIYRLAQMIHDHLTDESGMDTRYFDHPFINDAYSILGKASEKATYREHLVPRAYLRDKCLELYRAGHSVEKVSELLDKYLWIALLEPEQAKLIDETYKTSMPNNWVFGDSDVHARLAAVGIALLDN